MTAAPVSAFVGVGANLGQPAAQVERAIAALRELPQTDLVSRSGLYASAPVDELRAAVLGATAGQHAFSLADGRAVAWLTKQSEAAAAGHDRADA